MGSLNAAFIAFLIFSKENVERIIAFVAIARSQLSELFPVIRDICVVGVIFTYTGFWTIAPRSVTAMVVSYQVVL